MNTVVGSFVDLGENFPDTLRCVCGNIIDSEGFTPVTPTGETYVESEGEVTGYCRCNRCHVVFREKDGAVVGTDTEEAERARLWWEEDKRKQKIERDWCVVEV